MNIEEGDYVRTKSGKGKTEWKINPYSEYMDLDTLYDLIQAGLVEKVEE